MNKEEHYRETIDWVPYSGTQSVGEVLTRHQRTVGASRYGKVMGHTCESQGTSLAQHRPERNGEWVGGHTGLVSAQPRIASYGKSMLINEV
jgi:hypothetical protein